MKKSSIENLERIAIAASVIGTIVSALSSQAVYAAMPITFSLFLNLVNRNDIKKQTQSNVNISQASTKNDILTKLGRKIEEASDLNDRIENLAGTVKDVSSKQGNFQQQTQNNFDSLNSKTEEISNLINHVKKLNDSLNDLSSNQGNFQQQTQNNFGSLNSKTEEIPNLIDHVKNLNDSLNDLSSNQGNFQQQTQNNFGSLNSKAEDISDLPERVKILNNKLNDLSVNQGNFQQQTQNNFNLLNFKTEEILDLTERVKNLDNKLDDVSIKQGDFQRQTQNNFSSLISKTEGIPNIAEQVKNLVDTLKDLSINLEGNIESKFNQINQILTAIQPHRYELVYGRSSTRKKLEKALSEANKRLIMVCPWISQSAIDANIKHKVEEALSNEIQIDIGWGNLYDINNLNPKPNQGEVTQALLTNNRYDAVKILENFRKNKKYNKYMHLKLLGTHEKFLICDDNWALITSHNFLLSSDFSSEKEIGLLTYDKNIIANLVKHYDNAIDRS